VSINSSVTVLRSNQVFCLPGFGLAFTFVNECSQIQNLYHFHQLSSSSSSSRNLTTFSTPKLKYFNPLIWVSSQNKHIFIQDYLSIKREDRDFRNQLLVSETGIFGHKYGNRLKVFCSMLFTINLYLFSDFTENRTLLWHKNPY
jgi:hypothetical protein